MFKIDPESKFILYGAADFGIRAYHHLRAYNFCVSLFVDRRADEIEFLFDVPVIMPEEIKGIPNKSDYIAVISIKNVFEHESIAASFIQNGFTKVLYRPQSVLLGINDNQDDVINIAYDSIFHGKIYQAEIPEARCNSIYKLVNHSVAKNYDKNTVILAPMELVYVERKATEKVLPIATQVAQRGFFQYLNGQSSGNLQSYIYFCMGSYTEKDGIKHTLRWQESLINGRTMIYDEMMKRLEMDPDFFWRCAPTGYWDPRGFFIQKSGKHRATFLISKGHQYLPINIGEDNLEQFLNFNRASELMNYLEENSIQELPEYVPNPYFYQFRCPTARIDRKIVLDVIEAIVNHLFLGQDFTEFKDLTVYCQTKTFSYLLKILHYYGCTVASSWSHNSDLEKLMDACWLQDSIPSENYMSQTDILLCDQEFFSENNVSAKLVCALSDSRERCGELPGYSLEHVGEYLIKSRPHYLSIYCKCSMVKN